MSFFDRENGQDLIRIGEVSSVNYAKGTARVVFDDDDSLVSFDLPVLHRNTLRNHDYSMPDVGEDVVCIFLPSGTEEGFILGAIYAGENQPPESSGDKRTVVFDDGTRIHYDRAAHQLAAEIGDTKLNADRTQVNVESASLVSVKSEGVVTVEATSQINLKASAIVVEMGATTMTLSGNKAQIHTNDLEIDGITSIKGNLSVTGSISASGTITGTNVH